MSREKILIVEDEDILRTGLREYLALHGYTVAEAADCRSAEREFRAIRPDAVVIDYLLPDGTALDLIPRFRQQDSGVPLLVLTGHGTIDVAVRAMKEGADQFLTKPVEFPSFLVVIERTLENQRNRRRVAASRSGQARSAVDPFSGASAAIRELETYARRVASSDSPVLILGETGTGKSLLARWLHENGPRANEALVDFNCAGLSKELLDTELFGHEKGAFTGAAGAKQGLLEVAHRGTIFLDELGDMDPLVQPKLLKVIEEKRFRRLGATTDRYVDIRLVAATNQDLEAAVREKRFRSDLYYRVSTIQLTIPPLRERRDDIPELARTIVASLLCNLPADAIAFEPDAEHALMAYGWPGNIRELRNVLERAMLFRESAVHDSCVITARDLRLVVNGPVAGETHDRELDASWSLAENERRHIVRVLERCDGSVVEAARLLELSRSALYEKIRKHGISVPKQRDTTSGTSVS